MRAPQQSDSGIWVPSRIDGVDARWATEALRIRYPGVEVTALKVTEISLPNGTSTFASLEPKFNEVGVALNLPGSMILKGGFGRFGPEFDGLYTNEMHFYRDVSPIVTVNAPACFFADEDRSTGQSCVIMEDLRRGSTEFMSARTPLTFEQSRGFLSQFAHMHGQTWNHPAIQAGGEFEGWIRPLLGGGDDLMKWWWEWQFGQEYWEKDLSKRPQHAAISRIFQDRLRLLRAAEALKTELQGLDRCILHGDSHAGNLYIKDGQFSLLDFQVKAYPCWPEVAKHITSTLDPSDRRRWESALLSHYLDELRRYGGTPPSFDEAWALYRKSIVWPLCIWVTNDDRHQAPYINTACAARISVAALDHDTYGLLGV